MFTETEIAYLASQRLGRLATVQRDGTLQVSPVGFSYNPATSTALTTERTPAAYLVGDDIIDVSHPSIRQLAATLRAEHVDDLSFVQAAFEHVRDGVRHSLDAQDPRVTLSASETLREGVGLCFAKAHLLAALLRAEGIPTGLCYQRLTGDGSLFYLHGLVAMHLRGSWHRQDPRGNKPGVNAQFSITTEHLASPIRAELGECDYPELLVSPHPEVVRALRGATDVLALCRAGLPSHL